MADDVVRRLVTQFVVDAGDSAAKSKQFADLVQKARLEILELQKQGFSSKEAFEGLFSERFTQKIKAAQANIVALKEELKSMSSMGVQEIGGSGVKSSLQSELRAQQALLVQLTKESQVYGRAGAQAQAQLKAEQKGANDAYTTQLGLVKNLEKEQGKLNGTAKTTGTSWRDMAMAFGLASTAVGLLQQGVQSLIQYFQQASVAGMNFAKAVFQIDIAARALRRSGIDITTKEIYEQLDKLQKKFGVFATSELALGTAAFLNLNRDLGFTSEELFKMQDAIATLATVNGRSMDEVQKTVALALASGYTEGLQRLGVSINRVNIAEQASIMGWKKGYTALTEYQRSHASYVLLLEKTLKYEEDLAKYRETMPGQVEVNTATLKDYDTVIGSVLLQTTLFTSELKVSFSKIILYASVLVAGLTLRLRGLLDILDAITTRKSFTDYFNGLSDVFKKNADEAERFQKFVNIILDEKTSVAEGIKAAGEYAVNSLGENPIIPAGDDAEKLASDLSDILDGIEKEFDDILTEHARRLEAIKRDFDSDILRIERELERDLADLERDTIQRRLDINDKYQQDKAKSLADYNKKVAEAEYDYAQKRLAAETKYRENDLQAEIKYQETLRKLREGFVLDLEDALRERDALQILRLIRRYNLEKKQQTRQYIIEKDERKRQYSIELSELEEQRKHKLDLLKQELAEREAELYASLKRDIEHEIEAYNAKIGELQRQAQVDKNERAIRYTEQTNELNILLDQRISDLAKKYIEEESLTREHVNAIISEFERAFGAGGAVELLYKRFMEMMANGVVVAGWMDAGMGGLGGGSSTTSPAPVFPSTTPTGPSTPYIPPVGSNPLPTMSSSGPQSGQLAIELFLSPDLQAKIINNTLNQVANVLVEVQRKVL